MTTSSEQRCSLRYKGVPPGPDYRAESISRRRRPPGGRGKQARMGGTPQRQVAVSVDLDPVACYYRIHALGEPPTGPARHAILRRCLPRFAELFARHDLKATFFVVGA